MDKHILSENIKAEAIRLGFSVCGIAPAGFVSKDCAYLKKWISEGKNAGMKYMENHFDKRCNPQLLMKESQSVVSVALNYYPARLLNEKQYQFAWYAYGKDYHDIVKAKLTELMAYISKRIPVKGRAFCDTAPILERYWAWKAGLGWIGKNTQLIIPHAGSCFFLGELLLDIELVYDKPLKSLCGSCKRCMDACPSKALEQAFCLNSQKCLSYLTIENRGEISSESGQMMGNRIYGCDECQKACPWNRFATPTNVEEFLPSKEFMNYSKAEWENLTEKQYRELFKESAIKRATFDGLRRNIRLASEKKR